MGKAGGSVNKKLKFIWGVIWLIFCSVAFAVIWLRTPALWFINLPKSVWEKLATYSGASCCEDTANLEVLVGLGFGFLIGLLLMFIFLRLVRKTQPIS
jgi:hypothetical protein